MYGVAHKLLVNDRAKFAALVVGTTFSVFLMIQMFVVAACWLAAENLMLLACAMGLGTCVIGSCAGALNADDWKTALGVPKDWSAIAPIIVGTASEKAEPVSRKKAEIVSWRERRAT